VIIKFYEAYNSGDIDTIASLMDDDVEYHDMIYEEPFRGREEVVAFMRKVRDTVPSDLKFVVDDITAGDPSKVGVMWHVEIGDGTVFPFSRGCSFYTVNAQGRIVQARDLVESAAKPGAGALKGLAAVAPLIRRLGPDADPANLKKLPIAAAGVWAFYAAYTVYIMLGTDAPGLPVWQTTPEVLEEVLHESLNFFYVNIGLDALGVKLVPCVAEHPVSEGIFNFVSAWGMMFLPVMLTDKKSQKVGNIWAWWAGVMFLTNVFFIPFLALRAAPEPAPEPGSSSKASTTTTTTTTTPAYPSWAAPTAVAGLGVGLLSIYWVLAARPEFGGLDARWDFFAQTMATNRVSYAFVVDACLYGVWQAALVGAAPGATAFHKYVPFFGLAAHLLQAPREGAQQAADGGKQA